MSARVPELPISPLSKPYCPVVKEYPGERCYNKSLRFNPAVELPHCEKSAKSCFLSQQDYCRCGMVALEYLNNPQNTILSGVTLANGLKDS